MNRSIFVIIVALTIFIAFNLGYAAPKYVGVDKCKACHKLEKYGNQQEIWEKSKHAQAFAVLATEKAKESAKKLGVDDPQKSDKCLKCHVTGFGAAAEAKDVTFKMEEGVGCEACHGPGSDYKTMAIMKDQKAAIASGLIVPNEKTCKKCHTAEGNDFYKEFNYEKFFAQIAHPGPAPAPAQK